jgi:excisionase family DNA binding protein
MTYATIGSSDVEDDAPDRLCTLDEVRERLGGIARSTVHQLTASGELRSVRIGRRRFVPASELTRFVRVRLAEGGK